MMEDKERELKVILPEFGMSPELRNEIAKVIEQTLGNGQIVIYPKDIESLTVCLKAKPFAFAHPY